MRSFAEGEALGGEVLAVGVVFFFQGGAVGVEGELVGVFFFGELFPAQSELLFAKGELLLKWVVGDALQGCELGGGVVVADGEVEGVGMSRA